MNPESTNLHKFILHQHGREVLKCLRRLEGIVKKLGVWQNHRHFNVKCIHRNIIPTSINIISRVKGIAADKVLKKKLLQIRVRHCDYTIQKLNEEKNKLEHNLYMK